MSNHNNNNNSKYNSSSSRNNNNNNHRPPPPTPAAAAVAATTTSPIISTSPVMVNNNNVDDTVIRRIVFALKRACTEGAIRWCDTYGHDNVADLKTYIQETLKYIEHIECLLGTNETTTIENVTTTAEAKESVHSRYHYRFPDRELLTLYKELDYIANIPENAKLLVHSRRYQDVGTILGWVQTKLSRRFLYKSENQTSSENYIERQLKAAMTRLKRWAALRELACITETPTRTVEQVYEDEEDDE